MPESITERIELAWQTHEPSLRRFLAGVLADGGQIDDVVQSTFVVLMEKGASIRQAESLRSWLFRVAFNRAMVIKRKKSLHEKHQEKLAWRVCELHDHSETASDSILSQERVAKVKQRIETLSDDQQLIVRKRIYEGLKFREIAEQLDVPLGTVLARMQSSLKKLRPMFEADDV